MYGWANDAAVEVKLTTTPRPDVSSAGSAGSGHQERAGEVDGQRAVPVVEGVLVGVRAPLDRRRVDEHVEPAQFG